MRNDINNKPHEVLWLGLAVILGFAFIFPCETINLQLGSNSFDLAPMPLASIFILFLGFLGIIYSMTIKAGKKLTKWMTMFHLAFSLFFTITLIYAGCEMEVLSLDGTPRFLWAVLIFILAQLIFVINIVYAFLKK